MANKIKIRRGLKADLPTLDVGEPALCTDVNELYMGTSNGNLKLNKKDYGTIVLPVEDWLGNLTHMQVIGATGVTEDTVLLIDIVLDSDATVARTQAKDYGYLSKAVTSANLITFTCLDKKPTVPLTLQIREV